jgi:hypothetical protein
MPQQQAGQLQDAPQQQSSILEFGIALKQAFPDASPLSVSLGPPSSNELPNSIIIFIDVITCMAPHSKVAQQAAAS